MSEYNHLKDKCIQNDRFILDHFRELMARVKFIHDETRKLITELNADVELHLQAEELNDIWKRLLEDAIIFLKSNDKREEYHDTTTMGSDKLHKFLKGYSKFEPILYGAVANYRDHIAHVFRIFSLGEYIVRQVFGFENLTNDYEDLEISPDEKEAIWCIIALTHDLGMPLQAILICLLPFNTHRSIFRDFVNFVRYANSIQIIIILLRLDKVKNMLITIC